MSTISLRLIFGAVFLLADLGLVGVLHFATPLDAFERGAISGVVNLLLAQFYARVWTAIGEASHPTPTEPTHGG